MFSALLNVCVSVECMMSVVCQSDEGNILFKDALNILFTVVWYQDNGKKDNSDSER